MSAPSQGGGRTWLDACTLPVGSVGGVPVRVHLLFFAVVALGVVGQIGRPWQNMVWAALVYGPVLWATILLHEGGHCFAAKRLGAAVHSITLWPLGGVALIGQAASPRDDMIVALAGPATHLPQVAFWVCVELASMAAVTGHAVLRWSTWPPSNNVWLAVVTAAVSLNVALFAFNLLLPVYPLDGGRVFADALLMCGVPVRTAAFVVGGVGGVLAIGICIYGFIAGLGGILVVAIGVWALFSTAEVVAAAVRGEAGAHPLFCYGGGEGGGQGAAPAPQAPAWPPQAAAPPASGRATAFAGGRV